MLKRAHIYSRSKGCKHNETGWKHISNKDSLAPEEEHQLRDAKKVLYVAYLMVSSTTSSGVVVTVHRAHSKSSKTMSYPKIHCMPASSLFEANGTGWHSGEFHVTPIHFAHPSSNNIHTFASQILWRSCALLRQREGSWRLVDATVTYQNTSWDVEMSNILLWDFLPTITLCSCGSVNRCSF